MVELTGTVYSAGSSALHRLDARFKMICLVLFSIATIHAGFSGLLILFLTQVLAVLQVKISMKRLIREMRFVFIFLLLIFILRSLSTAGDVFFRISFFFLTISITEQGISLGALVCFRLFLVVLLGYLFIWSTPPSQVRIAVTWFLKPVPFIPERKVGTMLSLMIRFLPLILQETKETADAQRARCIENRKNPIYRFVKLTIPVFQRIFLRADDLILAMEARGYSENRALPRLYSKKSDWLSLVVVFSLALVITRV